MKFKFINFSNSDNCNCLVLSFMNFFLMLNIICFWEIFRIIVMIKYNIYIYMKYIFYVIKFYVKL